MGTELVTVEGGLDRVRAVVRDASTGRARTVRARYLVAADGAHSRIRTALGIPMHGPDRLRDVVTALFLAPLWKVLGERRYGIYAVDHPAVQGSFIPAGPGDRWLFGLQYEPGAHDLAEFTPARLVELIRLGSGVADLRPRIERVGRFFFAAQLAERFRDGAAFLVGDAAHRVTPRGGTGMNTAIHDGYDLGWKLAWVLRGWAGPELLDTYESERRPVAEHNVARSADPSGSLRRADEEIRADLGGRLAHIWLPGAVGDGRRGTIDRVSTLDLIGPGFTVLSGPGSGSRTPPVSGPVPVDRHRLDTITARALGIPHDGVLVVRPDGAPTALRSGAGSGGGEPSRRGLDAVDPVPCLG
jgi:2-polyprenyl-6-methoxyphenol hydroxylase-like FAD-dependent oxidoreductase